MSVEVAAWNVAHNLGRDNKRQTVFEGVERLGADLVVLVEAWGTEWNTPISFVHDTLGKIGEFALKQGYNAVGNAHYNDHDTVRFGHKPGFDQGMVVLGRAAVRGACEIRLGTRNALKIDVQDQSHSWQALGVHLDDRSAEHRYRMTESLSGLIKPADPWLLLGDFNSMPMRSRPARFTNNGHISDLAEALLRGHKRSLFERHQQMGDDGIIEWLESDEWGFTDADPERRSTVGLHGIPMGQLDHILTSHHLRSSGFRATRLKGSDHKAVSATISAA